MKQRKRALAVPAFLMSALLIIAVALQAQEPPSPQGSGQAEKLAALVKQLNLSPEQEMKLMPILKAEAPKVEAIKSNTSLTNLQKLEQLRALHEQTNPQVQAILSPQQYAQLQQIRQHEIEQTIRQRAQPQ
jgi:hypothetical protein